MNETAKELKTQEMKMERHMYIEEMQYRHVKDKELFENARLSSLNEGVVVAAMASLADAIQGNRVPLQTSPTTRHQCEEEIVPQASEQFSPQRA